MASIQVRKTSRPLAIVESTGKVAISRHPPMAVRSSPNLFDTACEVIW